MISSALLIFFPLSFTYWVVFISAHNPPFCSSYFFPLDMRGGKSIFRCLAAGWSQSSTILHSVNDFVWCLPNLRHLQNHITSICYCTILYSVLDVRIHQTGALSQAAVHVSHHRETAAIHLWKKREKMSGWGVCVETITHHCTEIGLLWTCPFLRQWVWLLWTKAQNQLSCVGSSWSRQDPRSGFGGCCTWSHAWNRAIRSPVRWMLTLAEARCGMCTVWDEVHEFAAEICSILHEHKRAKWRFKMWFLFLAPPNSACMTALKQMSV